MLHTTWAFRPTSQGWCWPTAASNSPRFSLLYQVAARQCNQTFLYVTALLVLIVVALAGPHGGVHSFKGCPDVVESELQKAAELGTTIKRWHSEKSLCTWLAGANIHRSQQCRVAAVEGLRPLVLCCSSCLWQS